VASSLQFGDRLQTEDLAEQQEQWRGYFKHLHAAGFDVEDAAYRHFAAEVFHDSPLRLSIEGL